jgi:hypothetical protein
MRNIKRPNKRIVTSIISLALTNISLGISELALTLGQLIVV